MWELSICSSSAGDEGEALGVAGQGEQGVEHAGKAGRGLDAEDADVGVVEVAEADEGVLVVAEQAGQVVGSVDALRAEVAMCSTGRLCSQYPTPAPAPASTSSPMPAAMTAIRGVSDRFASPGRSSNPH